MTFSIDAVKALAMSDSASPNEKEMAEKAIRMAQAQKEKQYASALLASGTSPYLATRVAAFFGIAAVMSGSTVELVGPEEKVRLAEKCFDIAEANNWPGEFFLGVAMKTAELNGYDEEEDDEAFLVKVAKPRRLRVKSMGKFAIDEMRAGYEDSAAEAIAAG